MSKIVDQARRGNGATIKRMVDKASPRQKARYVRDLDNALKRERDTDMRRLLQIAIDKVVGK